MKFGLSFLPDCTGHNKKPAEYFQEVLRLSVLADQGGLHYIKMTEHYLHPYGGYCPSPLAFLSAVASVTKQIRLLTGCILPSFHHPLQIASEVAQVDAISQGRLEIGFARAYLPYEFQAFGIDMNKSRDRYTKTIQEVLKLWTEKNFPLCTQQPHPPLWGAAVNSRQSFAWLGENLFNLLITPPIGREESLQEKIQIYKEAFHDKAEKQGLKILPQIIMSAPLLIKEDEEKALQASEPLLQHYLNVWSDATYSLVQYPSTDYPQYEKIYAVLKALTPEEMRKRNHALVGTPSQIFEKIDMLREKFSLDGLIWQIDFGEQCFETAYETLSLFLNHSLLHTAFP